MAESRAGTFSGRVVVLFATQVFGAALGIINGIILARLLGPSAKGDYYLLVLIPTTAMVVFQLGLPQAFGFYSARLQSAGIVVKSIVLTILLSMAAFLTILVIMPLLQEAFLHGIALGQILFAFLAFPLALNATFGSAIVMGRQAVRWYAAVYITYSLATTLLLIVILGGLGPTVIGAITVYLIATSIQAIGFTIGGARLTVRDTRSEVVSYGGLFRYALPFYPGSLTQFFSARADAYLIAWLMFEPSAPLGYYSLAVGLAEMVFFFPNAVAALFFPHVAGAARADSDSQVAMVSRVALLITAVVALALVPAAVVLIEIVLPAFAPSLPALFVLLPGVVALSATKVVGGYVTGIGRPGLNSWINMIAFMINIVANLVLIPRFGIVGAAAASLVSYTLSSIMFTVVAARLAHQRVIDFWVPRRSDVRFAIEMTLSLMVRVRRMAPGGS